jgi:hypothetical protein
MQDLLDAEQKPKEVLQEVFLGLGLDSIHVTDTIAETASKDCP